MLRRLCAILILGALIGCQGPLQPGQITLRVANWGGAGDDSELAQLQRRLYEEFEAENPGVRIQVEGIPGSQEYVSKMLLSHAAHATPDVIKLDASSSAAFIEYNVVRDISSFVENDREFHLDDYFPNVVDTARRGKKLYAIPDDFTPMVVYYNKALFDRAGVPYPKPDWTWDDFLQTARRLTRGSQFGFTFANWMPGWVMWLWNGGGDVVRGKDRFVARGALDAPANVATVEWLRDLVLKHKVAPSLSQAAAQGVDLFANQSAAMQISGHWAIVGLRAQRTFPMESLGVAPLPRRTGPSQTVMYESGFGIGSTCRHPELAWKYIKFMTSYKVQRRYNATGIAVCGRKDVSAEQAAKSALERDFLAIVPSCRAPWGTKIIGYDLIEDTGQRAMDSIMKNGVEPSVALRAAADEIDQALERL